VIVISLCTTSASGYHSIAGLSKKKFAPTNPLFLVIRTICHTPSSVTAYGVQPNDRSLTPYVHASPMGPCRLTLSRPHCSPHRIPLTKALPNPLQPSPNLPRNTHPRIHTLNPIPLPLLRSRSQTQRHKPQIAMIQIRPLVAGEFAETAHHRMLRQLQQVRAQSRI
jgi:hypothetical protein